MQVFLTTPNDLANLVRKIFLRQDNTLPVSRIS